QIGPANKVSLSQKMDTIEKKIKHD
ncbi:uncharacterized protein METZ01_LOCUS122741, partial [marine metagenome]